MVAAPLSDPIFHDEDAARAHFEALRWSGGVPVCFHCGAIGEAVAVKRDEAKAAQRKAEGKKVARAGLYYCRACGGQFTATMGTVYEDSKIPLHKWMLATHLMNSCKRGVSALELQRQLGLGSYRTAWFMAHRIREAMAPAADEPPLGGPGKVVEADETVFGRSNQENPSKHKSTSARPQKDKRPKRIIVALVERGGSARVFHVASATKEMVAKIIVENVHPASHLHTDESQLYAGADAHVAAHESVRHRDNEYARGNVTSNSVEGFFSQFKRGMVGVYQHCDEKYLQRYVNEFAFRHSNRVRLGIDDKERAALAVKGTVGKRLTLRHPKGFKAPATA